ncbi:hypothetical protein HG530_014150 [Fusarium avenaceum]|nr:hypothetical protein HG530_014150 [Fusarium avenaceum]
MNSQDFWSPIVQKPTLIYSPSCTNIIFVLSHVFEDELAVVHATLNVAPFCLRIDLDILLLVPLPRRVDLGYKVVLQQPRVQLCAAVDAQCSEVRAGLGLDHELLPARTVLFTLTLQPVADLIKPVLGHTRHASHFAGLILELQTDWQTYKVNVNSQNPQSASKLGSVGFVTDGSTTAGPGLSRNVSGFPLQNQIRPPNICGIRTFF